MSKFDPRMKDSEPRSMDGRDQTDFIKTAQTSVKNGSRAQSVPPKLRSLQKPGTASKDAGGMDEEQFFEAFDDYPRLEISSGHELEADLMKMNDVLSNPNEDWEKRVEQLRKLRGLIVAGATDYKEFTSGMRYVDIALQASVKDLRSQVVREACVTLAFMAIKLGSRCERTAEMNLPTLILLIPNSVKIMATSGTVAIRFILMHVHFHKLIPIITREYLTSKSKEIRRSCCEFIHIILTHFPKSTVEKHVAAIQEVIKKAMADADAEARASARQAFGVFSNQFPAQAQAVYKELDATQKKQLESMVSKNMTPLSNKTAEPASKIPAPKSRIAPSTANVLGPSTTTKLGKDKVDTVPTAGRSASAIDMAAARRAKARGIAAPAAGSSLRPPSKVPSTTSKVRQNGIASQSTPGSRSTSPTGQRFQPLLARKSPGPTASKALSRDASPNRSIFGGKGLSIFQPSSQKVQRKNSQDSSHSQLQFSDDESEGSMISEHSIASYTRNRQNAMNIRHELPDIVTQLSSANWTTKRNGLVGLQQYMARGERPLSHSELESVCSTFTRMMNDPNTKVLGMFLDVLSEFIRVHKLELGQWLQVFLTKLLTKQGAELIPTVQQKITQLMNLVRFSFPADTQFQHVLRFITDPTQTPNVRVKAAVLNYLLSLLQDNMTANEFKNSGATRIGVAKLINWSLDGKTPEIKKNSQLVLTAMKDLNEEEFNAIISMLDEYLQDAARKIVSGDLRRTPSSSDKYSSHLSVPLKKLSPMTPVSTDKKNSTITPSRTLPRRSAPPSASSPGTVAAENEENLNPDAIFTSFRRTTDEIKRFGLSEKLSSPGLTTSPIASKLTQAAAQNDLCPEYEGYSIVPIYANRPEQVLYLSTLADRLTQVAVERRFTLLRHLHEFIPLLSQDVCQEYIPSLLPVIVDQFNNSQPELAAWALACLSKFLKVHPMLMRDFPELIIVNIIGVQKGASKIVVKAAEDCVYLAAGLFPCETVVKILLPLMESNLNPENAAAVKMFGCMAQQAAAEDLTAVLPSVIPLLTTAYADHEESNMRKECVYGLIYTQLKVGESLMTPYLSQLPPSKIRLMNLYLKRLATPGQESTMNGGGDASPGVRPPAAEGTFGTAL